MKDIPIVEIILACVLIVLLIIYLFTPYRVMILSGQSMQPTINQHGIGIADMSQDDYDEFDKGDLAVLSVDYLDKPAIKRVVRYGEFDKSEEYMFLKGDNREESTEHTITPHYDTKSEIDGKVIWMAELW